MVKYKPKVAIVAQEGPFFKDMETLHFHHYQEIKANFLIYLQFRISAGFEHAVHRKLQFKKIKCRINSEFSIELCSF